MQKINEKNTEVAKKIFEQFLEKNNIIDNTRQRFIKIKKEYPRIFSKEINYLIKNTENLFLAPPEIHPVIINNLKKINEEIAYSLAGLSLNAPSQHLALDIKKYFNYLYSKFSERRIGFPIPLINNLNLKSCPYCNLNKFDFEKNEKGIDYIHLDHFYNKAFYPYLSLSFYNLIPCCPVCNSKFKREKNFFEQKHFHPHCDDIKSFIKFCFIIKNIDIFTDLNALELDIDYSCNNKKNHKKAENTVKTFNYTERYNARMHSVQERLKYFYLYNEKRLENFYKIITDFGFNISCKKQLKQIILSEYCPNLSDLNSFPLSKLSLDIQIFVNKS